MKDLLQSVPLIFYDSANIHHRLNRMAEFLESNQHETRFAIVNPQKLAKDLRTASQSITEQTNASPTTKHYPIDPDELSAVLSGLSDRGITDPDLQAQAIIKFIDSHNRNEAFLESAAKDMNHG